MFSRFLVQSGAVCAGIMLLSACASQPLKIAHKEDHLAAAGFAFHPANTVKRQKMLDKLPAHRFIRRMHDGKVFYVYADPTICDCLYVGDQKAYDAYEQYRQQQALVNQQQDTAVEYQDGSWNWGDWQAGPAWNNWNPSWNPAWGNWDPGIGPCGFQD